MTLKAYLSLMIAATLICWGVFAYVLKNVDPTTTNWPGFALFYVSLFLSLSGSAALAGFIIRFVGLRHELVFRSVGAAFRQSFLFASMIVSVLFLNAHDLFTWLNLLLLVLALSIIEFVLISLGYN